MKKGWTVLVVISLALFIIGLDATFMNVAMIYLVRDLTTTFGTVQTMIAVYSLIMACFFLFGAKLQDVIGRKKTFLSGALLYGIGTIIAATSMNSNMLLLGWSVIEGFGAALMLPATASIIMSYYTDSKQRLFAAGLLATMQSLGIALGPIVGGILTTYYSWRWSFGLEAIIVLIILLLSYSLIESKPTLKLGDVNLKGTVISIAGLLLLVLGVLQLNNLNVWLNYYSGVFITSEIILPISMIFAGVLLLVVFFFYQRNLIKRGKTPFMNVSIFKNRTYTLGIINIFIIMLILNGLFFILPLYVQTRWETNALITGLIIIGAPIGMLIFSLSQTKLIKHIKPNYIASLGFIVAIIGLLLLYLPFLNSVNLNMYDLIPGIFLVGSGFGLASPILTNTVLHGLKKSDYADGSGIFTTFNALGSAMGTVIIGIIYFIALYSSLLSSLPVEYPSQYQSQQNLSHDIYSWVEKVFHPNMTALKEDTNLATVTANSSASGMQFAFLVSAILLFVGLLISIFIKPPPMKTNTE